MLTSNGKLFMNSSRLTIKEATVSLAPVLAQLQETTKKLRAAFLGAEIRT
jgi:hypothetical protein